MSIKSNDKPGNIAWAIALVIGLSFGIPAALSTNRGYVRKVARGERIEDEPTTRRDTWDKSLWNKSPIPRALIQPLHLGKPGDQTRQATEEPPLVIDADSELVAISVVELDINRRIIGRLERIKADLEIRPDKARGELGLLIAELRERNEVGR